MVLLTASAFGAFDSEAWMKKRETLSRDAERLRGLYAKCAASDMPPTEDVTIPVEEYPDGSLKVVVHARLARYFMTQGLVWAENVSVRRYDRDGVLDSHVDARHCVVDRVAKNGWAEGAARFVHGKTTCTGEGVYFSATNGYIKVYDKTDIVSKDLKFGGLKP